MKMRTLWTVTGLVACLGGIVGAASADDIKVVPNPYDPATPEKRGQAGMTFLQVGGSARAEGMGGAFSGVVGEPSAVFYNPAAMATVRGVAVYASRTAWFGDITFNHLVASAHWRQYTAGLTFVNVDYGQVIHTIIAPTGIGYYRLGEIKPTAWAAGAVLAMRFTDRFGAGVHIKYAVQDMMPDSIYSVQLGYTYRRADGTLIGMKDNRIATVAYDIGTQYATGLRNIAINMSLTNYAGSQRFVQDRFDLPLVYRVGLATEVYELVTGSQHPMHTLLVVADGIDRRDVPLDIGVGVEYTADLTTLIPGTKVSLRAGRRPSRNQDGWLSVGAGINFQISSMAARLDYAYNDYGPHLTVSNVGLALQIR